MFAKGAVGDIRRPQEEPVQPLGVACPRSTLFRRCGTRVGRDSSKTRIDISWLKCAYSQDHESAYSGWRWAFRQRWNRPSCRIRARASTRVRPRGGDRWFHKLVPVGYCRIRCGHLWVHCSEQSDRYAVFGHCVRQNRGVPPKRGTGMAELSSLTPGRGLYLTRISHDW